MNKEILSIFKNMVLNFSLGNGMTQKQMDYVIDWAIKNISPIHFNKLAEIAWQYDEDKLSAHLQNHYNQFVKDNNLD